MQSNSRPKSPIDRRIIDRVVFAIVILGIAAGGAQYFAGNPSLSRWLFAATTGVALVPLTLTILRDILRRHLAVDVIALMAMAGALLLGEYLAGAVVALMLSGGTNLENYAASRAKKDLTNLLERAPKVAHRYEGEGLVSREVSEIGVGDRLLVKPGEVVPVDGTVMTPAILDESTLTGEANPVERAEGSPVKSGVVNTGSPFDMTATATVEASTYEAIVRLVREAQASKGPFIRMADRFAVLFLPATLGVAGAAWAFSGDPVRALAVLVVATPCPLILAAPVAWVSGLSRLAQQGVIVKGSSALEALGEVEILMMDKTGTLTEGTPRIAATESTDIETSELLRLAASLDQVSHHPYAAAIVKAAQERGMNLSFPQDTSEQLGTGINGLVDGRLVAVGKAEWVFPDGLSPRLRDIRRLATLEGRANVFVSVEGSEGGALILDDPLRPDAVATVRLLRHAGIRRVVLVTGDHPAVADMIGNAIGADSILSERSPEGKAEAVAEEKSGGKTVMVGDGINDAPALAMADVGVALGARGAAAHSEAADVVLTVDRIDRLADAILIAQRSRRIALQSVVAGMALSAIAMLFAAAGLLEPVAGAVVQEAIDVAVILNALRALRSGNRRVKVSHPELGDALSAPPA